MPKIYLIPLGIMFLISTTLTTFRSFLSRALRAGGC